MEKQKYCYIVGSDLQLYKVKEEVINKCLEYVISPLAIEYEINNKNLEELLKTLKKDIENK